MGGEAAGLSTNSLSESIVAWLRSLQMRVPVPYDVYEGRTHFGRSGGAPR